MKIKTNKNTGISNIEIPAGELMMLHEEILEAIREGFQATPAMEHFAEVVAQHMDEA